MENSKLQQSPGTPLFPLSPERVNIGKFPFNQSTPEFGKPSFNIDPFSLGSKSPKSPLRHSRNNSDAIVHGMIARFDNMSIKDFRTTQENAIKRIEIAKEMAEIESKKLKEQLQSKDTENKKSKEELRKSKKELEDSKEKERKVSRRVEVLMEELQRSKETHDHTVGVYDKEIRRARKEAFKSSSGLVKLQEELKAVRSSFKITQSTLESTKLKSSKYEQEAFTSQYQLVGVQEDLQKALERIKILEEEQIGLKQSLKEEEITRIALEGRIALPGNEDDEDEYEFEYENDLMSIPTSPMKSPTKRFMKSPRKVIHNNSDSEKENAVPKRTLQLKSLQDDLMRERKLRQNAQDQIEFMKMECQFQCCSCRIAEKSGHNFIHDQSYSLEMERIKQFVQSDDFQLDDIEVVDFVEHQEDNEPILNDLDEINNTVLVHEKEQQEEELDEQDDNQVENHESYEESHNNNEHDDTTRHNEAEEIQLENQPMLEPITPLTHAFKTVTTTTTIPMMFSPLPPKYNLYDQSSSDSILNTPNVPNTISYSGQYKLEESASSSIENIKKGDGTFDREAALEMIRQRRVRAKSVVLGQATPKKQMVEGTNRRDISAPQVKSSGWSK